jgi:aspartyl-tRNA(Asn)/glutamyl-tRNA(Gln) amidotransferase subunit A
VEGERLVKKPVYELSIQEAGLLLRAGELSAIALAEDALARISALDGELHSFVRVTRERALRDAAKADHELRAGIDRGPLHGIPYGLKDIYNTREIPTTCQSKLMLDYLPEEDAAVETKLREGGAVLLGKLATHEFALGGPSFELPMPPARNPWNTDHFTGASSSGSGAAVAAGLLRIALGSDTTGSIRGPACLCGAVGLKPTYGLVSRRGVFPLSYSLDHCGPITWTVEDAALALEVIAGFDPFDPSSVHRTTQSYREGLHAGVQGLRIAFVRHFGDEEAGATAEVVDSLDWAAAQLRELGAQVDEVRLPDYELFNACGRVIMAAEAYAIHEAMLKEHPEKYARYTYQRIAPGATLSAADLLQAYRLRRELTVAVNAGVLRHYDALLCANGLAPAARLDEFPLDWPPAKLATAVQTIPFAVTGNPALAMPTRLSASGLPLGMQIVGRPFDEATVLRIGAAFERVAQPRRVRPSLCSEAIAC